jgi:prepilin-type N-terminal cleavage/methylation domain-containing protein
VVVAVAALTGQRGVTLIELLIGLVISAIVLGAINGLAKLGADAQTTGRTLNELTYQGRFALERIGERARQVAPKLLSLPATNSTGDWFAPSGCAGSACVMYCLNGSGQLIETTTADTVCSGTSVIASNVSAFAAAVPVAAGAVDRSIATIRMTLASGVNAVSLSSSIRLGGGTL